MSLSAMGWLQSNLGLDVTGEWSQIMNINVGGVAYTCLRKTFLKHKDNPIFDALLKGNVRRSDDGSVVIDRDGMMFRHVLNFLRSGRLLLPDPFEEWDLLLDDARFYLLKDLEEAILQSYEYQQRTFRKSLPQAVCVSWSEATNAAAVAPPLPALQAHATGSGLLYQGSQHLATLDDAVATLLSVYGYAVQHWREPSPGNPRHSVFLTLGTCQR
jgi:hypothetical protein